MTNRTEMVVVIDGNRVTVPPGCTVIFAAPGGGKLPKLFYGAGGTGDFVAHCDPDCVRIKTTSEPDSKRAMDKYKATGEVPAGFEIVSHSHLRIK